MNLKYTSIFLVYVKFKCVTKQFWSLFIYHQNLSQISSMGNFDFRKHWIKLKHAVDQAWRTYQKKKKMDKWILNTVRWKGLGHIMQNLIWPKKKKENAMKGWKWN